MIQRVIIDVDGRMVAPQDAARPAPLHALRRRRLAAAASGATSSGARTARHLAFVSTSRDHKQEVAARRRRRHRRDPRRARGTVNPPPPPPPPVARLAQHIAHRSWRHRHRLARQGWPGHLLAAAGCGREQRARSARHEVPRRAAGSEPLRLRGRCRHWFRFIASVVEPMLRDGRNSCPRRSAIPNKRSAPTGSGSTQPG